MSALGPEWDAVFREPLDARRVSGVVALLARLPRWGMGGSSVVLEAPYLCYDPVSDPLHGLVGDVADELTGFIHPRGINFAFRRADRGETVDGAAQVFILHVLQLVRQQKDQHVFMRGQYAGDLGVGCHSCCAPPCLAVLLTEGGKPVVRNRTAILQLLSSSENSPPRTPFASATRRAVEILYRGLEWTGDQVAALGARLTGGAA